MLSVFFIAFVTIKRSFIVPEKEIKCFDCGETCVCDILFLVPPENCFFCLDFDMFYFFEAILSEVISGLAPG